VYLSFNSFSHRYFEFSYETCARVKAIQSGIACCWVTILHLMCPPSPRGTNTSYSVSCQLQWCVAVNVGHT
jgi:hypothetical protein